jgi:glycosyltransferase involved in cell wall biosynthesis
MPGLSVILPCYNEAENIPFIFEQFRQAIPAGSEAEIILVNNGSTDNSTLIFEQQQAKYQDGRFRIVTVEKNQGYGFGILSGLAAAQSDILAWTHADLQTPPRDVWKALEKFEENNRPMTLVKGRRQQRAIIPAFFTWGMQVVASAALGVKLEDIAAQPKLFSRTFYEKFLKTNAPHDFSLDLFALYHAKKEGQIIEFPVFFEKRLHGEAKGGGNLKSRIKITRRTFKYIFELKKSLEK